MRCLFTTWVIFLGAGGREGRGRRALAWEASLGSCGFGGEGRRSDLEGVGGYPPGVGPGSGCGSPAFTAHAALGSVRHPRLYKIFYPSHAVCMSSHPPQAWMVAWKL